jgi:copper chaperone CopZ
VSQVPGVTLVDVDIDARSVRVEGEAADEAIVAAIDEAGYEVVPA